MTAPSIKEALEYERRIRTKIYDSNILTAGEWVYLVGVFQAANEHDECPTLATLSPPAGERREAIARILEPQAWAALGIGDTLAYKNRRTSSLRKADRILASSLVQDEAVIPDGYALVPIKPTMEMLEAGTDSNPTDWNDGTDPGFAIDVASDVYTAMVRAAIRSARDGGEE